MLASDAARDPDRERLEALVARVRREPAAFADVKTLETAAGLGSSKLHEQFRRHFHATPAQILHRARVTAAQRLLLANGRPVADVAFQVGYEGLSTFNENFRRLAAMSPQEYRRLLGSSSFRIALPASYRVDRILRYLGRDQDSLTLRVEGTRVATGLRIGGEPTLLTVQLEPGAARAELASPAALPANAAAGAHAYLLGLLGLTRDPAPFERRIAAAPRLAPLLQGRRGLRIPQLPDPFNGLTWVILGQQITLSFAFTLRRRLVERAAAALADGRLFAPPTAEAVANLEVDDLVRDQFSRRKAEYLIGVARQVVSGELPLDELASAPATRVEPALLAVRGLGPWSAHYLMMRSFGFEDCVPEGDAGLVRGLMQFFVLADRPDAAGTRELMRPFAPYRSWATFHLWQSLGNEP
jgi:AraC family transcriptional regulator of adaptative response / DNA-3-methyladenine glycosylase II